ncbi:hypothetical protein LZ30DRAFT_739732 [Colletotrichum cereale]|nr:hypothetical protein LZ30DRAFT_739732 [Colletotrichum cereale]
MSQQPGLGCVNVHIGAYKGAKRRSHQPITSPAHRCKPACTASATRTPANTSTTHAEPPSPKLLIPLRALASRVLYLEARAPPPHWPKRGRAMSVPCRL